MSMKGIIYYRKSTDRDDKQVNSLEHQLSNCERVASLRNIEIKDKIGESRSAKTEFKRPGFNELITKCKRGNIDYIIIDEPKRLSRNNIDTSRIIDLMDKNLIKGIIGTSREYNSDNSRDKFLLQLDLSLSKMDNEDRGKDIRDKMRTCIKNTGRFLGKAPFGYKNVTIKKGHKEIHIDKLEGKIVKDIFKWRADRKAYSMICVQLKEKYGSRVKLPLTPQRIQKITSKTFYYGVFRRNGKDVIGSHEPLVSKEMFDRVNEVGPGIYEHDRKPNFSSIKEVKYPLKGFVKDSSGIFLTGYKKGDVTYYGNQYRSEVKVCINEDLLFSKIGEIIKENDINNEKLTELDKKIIYDLIMEEKNNMDEDFKDYDSEILDIKKKQNKLLDMNLESKISDEVYLMKNNFLEEQVFDLKRQKSELKNDNFEENTQKMLELVGGLYKSYSCSNKEVKTEIIKNLMLELSVSTKKELQMRKTPLFESSKILNFSFGIPVIGKGELFESCLIM